MTINHIQKELLVLRTALKNHQLYAELSSLEDIRIFMESHVYAVWDFMSLAKALQITLTCTTLPWKPVQNASSARFINEIILEEETDVNEQGRAQSHFEMYLEAMEEVGAPLKRVNNLLESFSDLENFQKTIEKADLLPEECQFLSFTFSVVQTQKPHIIAAAFTFGREDLIPDMFLNIIEKASRKENKRYHKLSYYLKRHIELDGEDHGPLAIKMIEELCGNDQNKWEEVLSFSKQALEKRLALWNGITQRIAMKQPLFVDA